MPTVEKDVVTTNKPYSNYRAFTLASLVPKEIECLGYKQAHPYDESCHTRLPLDVKTILAHVPSHGGGFKFTLRKGDKEWPGWKELINSGFEVHDFRCDVCNAVLPLTANQINFHMRPHAGNTRKVRDGGAFLMTLASGRPLTVDEDFENAAA